MKLACKIATHMSVPLLNEEPKKEKINQNLFLKKLPKKVQLYEKIGSLFGTRGRRMRIAMDLGMKLSNQRTKKNIKCDLVQKFNPASGLQTQPEPSLARPAWFHPTQPSPAVPAQPNPTAQPSTAQPSHAQPSQILPSTTQPQSSNKCSKKSFKKCPGQVWQKASQKSTQKLNQFF